MLGKAHFYTSTALSVKLAQAPRSNTSPIILIRFSSKPPPQPCTLYPETALISAHHKMLIAFH